MNNAFEKLAKEIDFTVTQHFENIKVTEAKLEKNNIFNIEFFVNEIIPFYEMELFLIKLRDNFQYKTKFQFNVLSIIYNEAEVNRYLDWIVSSYMNKKYISKIIMASKKEFSELGCTIFLKSKYSVNQIQEIKDKIEKIMSKMGFNNFKMTLEYDKANEGLLQEEFSKNLENAKNAISATTNESDEDATLTRKRAYQKFAISELPTSQANLVMIEGQIFNIDTKKTKTSWVITTFSITDFHDAIYVKVFSKNQKEVDQLDKYNVGSFVTINGKYELDAFLKEPIITANKISLIKSFKEIRTDKAKHKRIELNCKTRMSAMDGISSATELVKKAEEWGHEAIAIVDKDGIQSFTDFYNATKKSKVKPIYGATFDVISRNNKSIYNHSDKTLERTDYIVFDIETTGLSPIFDEIIEFGAVKISSGEIIEKKQFFIKPSKPISQFTKNLTGITDDHLQNAVSQEEGVQLIRDYILGYTTVAHNANFDITFINEKLHKYNIEIITDPVIDSMIVARIVEPDKKRFNLGAVAKRQGVDYDSSVAHRGDYDADILARIWLKFLNQLSNLNLKTQKELFDFIDKSLYEKTFSNDMVIIAKNQIGLKKLFKLTSLALVDNYANGAKLFIDDLKDRGDFLIGSGGLNSRLLDRMFYGSKEQIIKEISFYDYIEIQPLQNFKHFINRGVDVEDIKFIIKFIVDESIKQEKIVVATCDSRYINPEDNLYHRVYISAKGLGGVRHPLFKFNEENPVYPDQHILTTEEMIHAFDFLGDIKLIEEVVITNTKKIADQVEKIQVIKEKLYTPKFGDSNMDLTDLVYRNAKKIYGAELPKLVENRIKKELEPIISYGFAVIYWISHLLVKKSLDDGYLVGSRGSVGSSLVATLAEITEVNPLEPHYICGGCQYFEVSNDLSLNSGFDLPEKKCPNCDANLMRDGQNIPFETFLGFNADKVPDIDLNFSGDYQPIIHQEVKKLFGDKHAFRAGTISTVAERTAFGYVKGWAEQTGKKLSRPFTEYLAKGVAGTKRTSGQHPGGIIVIPSEFDVEDFTPINYPANDVESAWKTTHFDFYSIHDNVLKLDLLGHDDPTALKLLEKFTGIQAKNIPMNDPKIISLFSSPEELGIRPRDILAESTGALGIPEFGTNFVRGMLKTTNVTSFGDLVSVSGLSHGTDVWATNAELLVRNDGKTLTEVISCRDDIMIDLINKGVDPLISFKIMENVRKGQGLNEDWTTSMKEHGVEDWYIDSLLKIKYMFPKAHAVAYVTMAWRVAWFKLYYPIPYYATYFTTRADVFDIKTVISGKTQIEAAIKDFKSRKYKSGDLKLSNKEIALIPVLEIANEALARGVKIGNISMKDSLANEWVIMNDTLIPPFSAIDGLGDSVAKSIIAARTDKAFVSKEDIKKRTSVNNTTLNKFEELGITSEYSDSNQMSLDFGF
ncbi:PolC-type DNA polymerase III [Candidatus Mycoplasma mahonii]|uniref:PolC-type DNA polymerase III n=1 Tax=Candidatus Mycoplasma mahonii TaxID=3004105 RepID=UPI0026EAE329|nr:PolC-type DNA polymerase III [Candidatus Mycoplasma mahonii]WKX02533.1 PolC-type DNA polymerase III [Candidatus Mycoplasma mahonii]